MKLSSDLSHVVRFDLFEVDLRSGELHQPGSTTRLQDQPLQILALLLEHPGEVVTRAELEKRLWPDGVVVDFEHGINSAVKRLRKALGDDAEHPRYIETLPRLGYRFIGQVESSAGLRTLLPAAGSDSVPTEPALRLVTKVPRSEYLPGSTRMTAALVPPRERRAFALPRLLAIALAAVALIAAIDWAHGDHYFRLLPETSSPPMKAAPLTSFLGSEEDPTFSPDGKQIAFAWNGAKEDNYDVYMKMLGLESLLRLTATAAIDRAPAWSPDGRHIAFHPHTEKGDGIYLVSVLGRPEWKLCDLRLAGFWHIEQLDWSPDGNFLAFS